MKEQTEDSRQIVDRFLAGMAVPLSEEQTARATAEVLERLRADKMQILKFPVVAENEPQVVRSSAWGSVAAAVVVMFAGGLLQILLQRSIETDVDVVARSQGVVHSVGQTPGFPMLTTIEAGRLVRADRNGGAIVLLDGSQIDMSPGAELSIVREKSGVRVRLASGTVLVSAVKQKNGYLYVETRDCVVSVVGTLFAVSAEASGSRVSVLEGEVKIQRGEVSQTLLAGQQASTSPQLRPLSEDPGTGWLSPERLALLQQPAVPVRPVAAPQDSPATSGSIVRGVVKGSDGVGIAEVSVTLCGAAFANVESTPGAPSPVPFDDTVQVTPVVRNKTFFFALFDAARAGGRCGTTVMTDAMGRFQFSNVASGEYIVRADREGFTAPVDMSLGVGQTGGVFRYFTGWGSSAPINVNSLGDTKNVTVYAQQLTQEISLTLVRAGVISGRVRLADGRFVTNAPVRIVSLPVQGTIGDGSNVTTTTTNDRGEYRAFWLPPGEYRVVVSLPGRLSPDTWFPRGSTALEATSVVVREGEEVPDIDIVVGPR